jgi:hypothetical protein
MRRPCGASFGFGGKLAAFQVSKHTVQDPATGQAKAVDSSAITLMQVRRRQHSKQVGYSTASKPEHIM